jgi:protein-disulfide isomerase/rRNA maturation endonuclease Nob1
MKLPAAAIFCLIALTFNLSAQAKPEILAVANGKNYTAADLPAELGAAYRQRNERIAELRREIFSEMAAEILLETEAAARKTSVEKLFADLKSKISAPTDAQIQAVYDANREKIGDRSLSDTRGQIVEYLRAEAEHKALGDFINALKTKYKAAVVRDVNAPNLKPTDAVFVVGARTVTAAQFERKAGAQVYELRAELYEAVAATLDEMIFSALVAAEAEKSGLAPGDLIAREVTDKMREYTDAERRQLETGLRQRLYQKYGAKILIKEPTALVQNISADDDPFEGKATAPVTVVMFSDFQCPACAQTHPVLKRVLAEYGDKARLVVRDFPLVERHQDAFAAAVAANAARAQGKFFEYIEVLYRHQNALDQDSLKKYAADLGLNEERFALDLKSERLADEVRKDLADGKAYGVRGTPTIFVNGVKVRQLSAEAFRKAIDRALDAPPKTPQSRAK